jgi:serine phosphatase RsbU (regulator of sigma subunit)
MELNTTTGRLRWVNAGHPAPLLIRNHEVTGPLEAPATLPVGLGGKPPTISESTGSPVTGCCVTPTA